MTATRIVRSIGIVGLIGWFAMAGWVARTTLAQNPNGGALPLPVTPAGIDRDGPPPVERAPAPLAQAAQKPSALAPAPAPSKPREAAPPPIGPAEPPLPTAPAEPAAKQALAPYDPVAVTVAAPSSDDPERSAQAFVERSRKEAESNLKALTAEAAQLRARLARLESGIKRWQSLVNALKGTQAQAATEETPSDLEPLPQAAAADPRADRRVKWASSPAAAPAEDVLESPAPSPSHAPHARPSTAVAPGLVPR
jgi:hypothetical protein